MIFHSSKFSLEDISIFAPEKLYLDMFLTSVISPHAPGVYIISMGIWESELLTSNILPSVCEIPGTRN